jgi:hypothetical protein
MGYRLFSAVDLKMDDPDHIKRKGERATGQLQGPDGGAMARNGPSSLTFSKMMISATV